MCLHVHLMHIYLQMYVYRPIHAQYLLCTVCLKNMYNLFVGQKVPFVNINNIIYYENADVFVCT